MASPLKNLVKALLQRHLGPWLHKELTVEQLSSADASIFGLGVIRVQDLKFSADKLNQVLESAGVPLRLCNLFVEQVDFSLPALYTSLSSSPNDSHSRNSSNSDENPTISIHGVEVVLRPYQVDTAKTDNSSKRREERSLEAAILTGLNLDPKTIAEKEIASLRGYDSAKQRDEGLQLLVDLLHQVFKSLRVTIEDVVVVVENSPFRAADELGASKPQALAIRFDRFEFFDLSTDSSESASSASGFDRIKKSIRLDNFRVEIVDKPPNGIYIVKSAELRNSLSLSRSQTSFQGRAKSICYHESVSQIDELSISFEKVRGGKLVETKPKSSPHSQSPIKDAPASSTSRNIALDFRFAAFTVALDPTSMEFLTSLSSKIMLASSSNASEDDKLKPDSPPRREDKDVKESKEDPLEKSMTAEEISRFQSSASGLDQPDSSFIVNSDSDEDQAPFPPADDAHVSEGSEKDSSFYDANEGSVYSSFYQGSESSSRKSNVSSPKEHSPSKMDSSFYGSTSTSASEPLAKPLKLKTWTISVFLESATLKLDYIAPAPPVPHGVPVIAPRSEAPYLEISFHKIELRTFRPPRHQNRAKYVIDFSLSEVIASEFLWASDANDRLQKVSSLLFSPKPLVDESSSAFKKEGSVVLHFEISRNFADDTYSSSLRASLGVLEADLDFALPSRLLKFFDPVFEILKSKELPKESAPIEPLPPVVEEPALIPVISQSTIGREFKPNQEFVPEPKLSASYDSTISEISDAENSDDESFHDIDVRFWLLKINILSSSQHGEAHWLSAHHHKESLYVEIVKPRINASIVKTTVGRQVIVNFDELAVYLNHGEGFPLTQIFQVLQRTTDPLRDQVEHAEALTITMNDPRQFNGPVLPTKSSLLFDSGIERVDYRSKNAQASSVCTSTENEYVDPASLDPEKSGPFSQLSAVFEGSAPLPTLLSEQEFVDWRDKVMERSKALIVINFKRVALDISSQHLSLFLKIVSGIVPPSNEVAASKAEIERPHEYPRSHILSVFTIVSRVSSCQIILKSDVASKLTTKSIELELSGIELLSIDGYRDRSDLSYRCVNIERTHGYYFDELHDRRPVLNSAMAAKPKPRVDSFSSSTSSTSSSVPLNSDTVRSEEKKNALAFRMTSYKDKPTSAANNQLFFVNFTRSLLNFEHGTDWFYFLYEFIYPPSAEEKKEASPAKEEVKQPSKEPSTFKFILDVDGCGVRYLPRTRVGNHIFALVPSLKFFYISPAEASLKTFNTAFNRQFKELLSSMHFQLRDLGIFFGNTNPYEIILPNRASLFLNSYKELLHENFIKFDRIKFTNPEGLVSVDYMIELDHLHGSFLPRDLAQLVLFFSSLGGEEVPSPTSARQASPVLPKAAGKPSVKEQDSIPQALPKTPKPLEVPEPDFDPNEQSQFAKFLVPKKDEGASPTFEKSFEPVADDGFDDGFKPWSPFDSASSSASLESPNISKKSKGKEKIPERVPREDDDDELLVLVKIQPEDFAAPAPAPSAASSSPLPKEPPSVKFYHGKSTLDAQVQEDYRPPPSHVDSLSEEFSSFDTSVTVSFGIVEVDLLELSDSWTEENDLTGSIHAPAPNKIATANLSRLLVRYVSLPDEGGRARSKFEVTVVDAKVLDRGIHSNFKSVLTFDERSARPKKAKLARFVLEDDTEGNISKKKLFLSVLPLQVTLDQDTRTAIESFILVFREANKRPSVSPRPSFHRILFESVVVEATSVAIDYKAKSLAVKEIAVSPIELLNLVSVEGVFISLTALKEIDVEGWEGLQGVATAKWAPSLIRQAPLSYLQSIRYLRPFAAFGSGLRDLAVIPYENYRETGSITSAATSAVISVTKKLTQGATEGAARLTVGASTMFEGIEKAINIEGEKRSAEEKPSSRFANQPANFGEGLTKGYDALIKQLKESKDNIVAIPLRHYEQHGTLGFVTALAKAVPLAVVKPIRGTTEAASQVFLGARNQMLPEEKKASDQKYYGGSDEKK